MSTTVLRSCLGIIAVAVVIGSLGCNGCGNSIKTKPTLAGPPPTTRIIPPVGGNKTEVSPNVWIEAGEGPKRVIVGTEVCLREGGQYGLECFLCSRNSKEHESILVMDADAYAIHQALEKIGAKPGSVMQFEPFFQAPPGSPIQVSLQYDQGGKTVVVPKSWTVPADTPLLMMLTEKVGDEFVYSLPTYELPADKEFRAGLSYLKDDKRLDLPELGFQVPAGPPVQIRYRYEQDGKVVVVPPPFLPPTGMVIQVSVQFEQKGKLFTMPAAKWIRNVKTRKDLEHEWVFAGSILVKNNPLDPDGPPRYLASGEGIICICNRPAAMLDLPVFNSKDVSDKLYELNTDRIPPVGTKVLVLLEPILDKK